MTYKLNYQTKPYTMKKTTRNLLTCTLCFFTFLSLAQTPNANKGLHNEIITQTDTLKSKEKQIAQLAAFLHELKKSDSTNSLIPRKIDEIEWLTTEANTVKSKLYDLKLSQELAPPTQPDTTKKILANDTNHTTEIIESNYGIHLANNTAKNTYKNTKVKYLATVLHTNFSIPIARFNFYTNDETRNGNVELFNSVGAGFGVSWGSMTDYRDENGELENSEFLNTFSLHGGFIFSAGSTNNVFAPVLSIGIVDFQLGIGYELGSISENQSRNFITIGYTLPLYKLVKGHYWFIQKRGLVQEVAYQK